MIYLLLIIQVIGAGSPVTMPGDIEITSMPDKEVIIRGRVEVIDSFERATIAPWTTHGDVIFAIRDTADTYGPQTPAFTGYQYPGHPNTDLPEYPSPGSNPGYITYLESPTVDMTGCDSCFISFSYWGDFEGEATNFDGFIVEISSNNGGSWAQVDLNAVGHLIPTYDHQLANTGQLLTAWAYCYDTDPNWVNVASLNLVALGYVANGNQMKLRFTFAYDALDGGQGCFIDDVRIADVPPSDQQAPVIVHSPLSDTPDTVNAYTITATVTDGGSGVNPDSVILNYLVEGQSAVDVVMTETSPDVYEAVIPAQSWHTDIRYNIRACDNAGNGGQTQTYNFEVTNAITIWYDDGQPYWTYGDLVPGDGMFVQYNFAPVGLDSGILHQVKYFFASAGYFDLEVYSMSGGQPGTLIYSRPGLVSLGYAWYTEDITNADIHMSTDPVVGFIIGPPLGGDTIRCLMDPVTDYPNNMWILQYGAWGNPTGGGDHMIHLKVIPLPPYGVEEGSIRYPITSVQLAPNPMSDKGGALRYQLPQGQHVSLRIYDLAGKLVRTLVDEHQNAGSYTTFWNGRDGHGRAVANGIYFFALQTETQTITKKALVVR